MDTSDMKSGHLSSLKDFYREIIARLKQLQKSLQYVNTNNNLQKGNIQIKIEEEEITQENINISTKLYNQEEAIYVQRTFAQFQRFDSYFKKQYPHFQKTPSNIKLDVSALDKYLQDLAIIIPLDQYFLHFLTKREFIEDDNNLDIEERRFLETEKKEKFKEKIEEFLPNVSKLNKEASQLYDIIYKTFEKYNTLIDSIYPRIIQKLQIFQDNIKIQEDQKKNTEKYYFEILTLPSDMVNKNMEEEIFFQIQQYEEAIQKLNRICQKLKNVQASIEDIFRNKCDHYLYLYLFISAHLSDPKNKLNFRITDIIKLNDSITRKDSNSNVFEDEDQKPTYLKNEEEELNTISSQVQKTIIQFINKFNDFLDRNTKEYYIFQVNQSKEKISRTISQKTQQNQKQNQQQQQQEIFLKSVEPQYEIRIQKLSNIVSDIGIILDIVQQTDNLNAEILYSNFCPVFGYHGVGKTSYINSIIQNQSEIKSYLPNNTKNVFQLYKSDKVAFIEARIDEFNLDQDPNELLFYQSIIHFLLSISKKITLIFERLGQKEMDIIYNLKYTKGNVIYIVYNLKVSTEDEVLKFIQKIEDSFDSFEIIQKGMYQTEFHSTGYIEQSNFYHIIQVQKSSYLEPNNPLLNYICDLKTVKLLYQKEALLSNLQNLLQQFYQKNIFGKYINFQNSSQINLANCFSKKQTFLNENNKKKCQISLKLKSSLQFEFQEPQINDLEMKHNQVQLQENLPAHIKNKNELYLKIIFTEKIDTIRAFFEENYSVVKVLVKFEEQEIEKNYEFDFNIGQSISIMRKTKEPKIEENKKTVFIYLQKDETNYQ